MRIDLHYGVVVGIDHYPAMTNLQLARRDAQSFYDWLLTSGVPPAHLELVTLPSNIPAPTERRGAIPQANQIWEAVYDKMDQVRAAVKADPADWVRTRLYFFFSGHGVAPTARDASGLAADAGPDHLGNSASIKQLVTHLSSSGDFAELVMIADCCRNRPQPGTQTGAPPWRETTGKKPEDVKVAELYATIFGDPSREPPAVRDFNKERGYFTKAILEGLSGHPGAVRNGEVTTVSLSQFARQRVMEETKNRQKPSDQVGADLILVTGVGPVAQPPNQRRAVRIRLPAEYRGAVELLDGSLQPIDTWVADGSDQVRPLPPSLYQLKSASRSFAREGVFLVPAGEGELLVSF